MLDRTTVETGALVTFPSQVIAHTDSPLLARPGLLVTQRLSHTSETLGSGEFGGR
jgi:hypothetical protein